MSDKGNPNILITDLTMKENRWSLDELLIEAADAVPLLPLIGGVQVRSVEIRTVFVKCATVAQKEELNLEFHFHKQKWTGGFLFSNKMTSSAEEFHAAVRENNRNQLEISLKKGADINCFYYGMTPLHVAITKGHIDLAIWLIGQGADIYKSEINGENTPFEEAVIRDQVQVVKALGKNGVSFDQTLSNGHVAITFAASNKHTYLSQILIEGGADVDLVNSQGETALWLSSREGFTGLVEQLIKAGANLNTQCGPESLTPVLCSVVNEQLTTTKLLIKAGCDLNIRDSSGWTPLWHAVSNSNEDLVMALISGGADVNVTDASGRTLLEEATENEDDDILNALNMARR